MFNENKLELLLLWQLCMVKNFYALQIEEVRLFLYFSAQTMQFVFEDKGYCEWPRYMYIDSYNYLWVTGQKSNEVVCLKLSENNKKMLFNRLYYCRVLHVLSK